jgi:diaminohydroxyphosphoribosylaminopyrimidine deaminase / 5-amino-6-(5-phosphoribosylamino)uracil reductase
LTDDARWMAAAIACSERGYGRTWPNPNVGCVIVADGRVVGRGWTQPGGRPHAEAVALEQAGESARGSTLCTTLEPCAHASERGPTCSDLIVDSAVSRVVIAVGDPDSRTDGKGAARLRAAGIEVVEGVEVLAAKRAMAGFLTRQRLGRPHVTLKLALSLDGCIAMGSSESQWITGPEARAHGHLERSRVGAILVGRGTYDADAPKLDVRLAELERLSPVRYVLSKGATPSGWQVINTPQAIHTLPTDHLLIEGGAQTAAAFLTEDLVDRLLIYRAPILIGGGKPAITDIGLTSLSDAHGRWRAVDTRMFGSDRLDIYERVRE